jgi:hypothetical protein
LAVTKAQKRRLADLAEQLGDIRAELGDLAAELESAYDNRSERWQESEKGQDAQGEIDGVRQAEESAGEAETALEDLIL